MRKDLKKLRQSRADVAKAGKLKVEELNKLLDKAELNDDEKARLDALEKEVDGLEAQVVALDAEIADEEKKARRSTLFGSAASTIVPARRITSDELNPELTGGFRNLNEFAIAVRNQCVGQGNDPRLFAAPSNVHQNQGSSGEGFLVPTEYRQQIWELVFQAGDLLTMVDAEPTNSNVVQITKDETTPWGSSGVQAAWRAEGAIMTGSKQKTDGALVQLHELYAFVTATDELLADGPRLQNRLTNKAAQAIRWKASDAIMWGDGNGKPQGFMNAPGLVSVAKEAGQAGDTVVTNNIAKMFSRLVQQNLGGAFWMANSDTLPQLIGLTIGNQPIWTPPNAGLQSSPGGFLLGRPLLFSEHCETLGEKGDLVLVDGMGYYLTTKAGGGIDFASSIHLYFDYNMTAFRWVFRVGGQPYLSAPIAPARGATTKSHFVSLDQRA